MTAQGNAPRTPKASDQYQTPDLFWQGVNAEFRFTVDAAATAENTKCKRYLTYEIDALSTGWGERGDVVWCNCPYSPGNIPKFLSMAAAERHRGVTSVLLVPLDPGRSWVDHVFGQAAEVRAIIGRITFIDGETGKPASGSATKSSALIVYRPYYVGPTLFSYVERASIEAVGKMVTGAGLQD